jgi:hypothetical protein
MIMDYKTLLINIGSFGISLTNIDMVLKIILLSVTIGYTLQKWYLLNKNKKKYSRNSIIKQIINYF